MHISSDDAAFVLGKVRSHHAAQLRATGQIRRRRAGDTARRSARASPGVPAALGFGSTHGAGARRTPRPSSPCRASG
jgi:hypothetical protein